MPSQLETEISKYRAALTAQDAAAQARLIGNYQRTRRRLIADVRALGQITEIRQNPSKLYRHDRAVALLGRIETELSGLGAQVTQDSVHTQRILARAGAAEAQRLAELQRPGLGSSFHALPTRSIENLTGMLGDGSPFAESAGTIFGAMKHQALDQIEQGLALGEDPLALIRRVGKAADRTFATRVQPLVRGALLGANRQASLETYQENDDLISGYLRLAAKSGTTCLACLALDGTTYPLNRMMPLHPNCRCSLVPIVKGAPLAFETGQEWFAAQPEAFQRSRLGDQFFEEYRAGKLGLDRFVAETDDARWGLVVRERSRKAALAGPGPRVSISKARPRKLAPPKPANPFRAAFDATTDALISTDPYFDAVDGAFWVPVYQRGTFADLRAQYPAVEAAWQDLRGRIGLFADPKTRPPLVTLPLDGPGAEWIATQKVVMKGGVEGFLNGAVAPESDLPVVVRYQGKHYLLDGHHRFVASRVAGQTTFDTVVFDVDALLAAPTPLTAEDIFRATLDEAVAAGKLPDGVRKSMLADQAAGRLDAEEMRDFAARLGLDVDPRLALTRQLDLAVREGALNAADADNVLHFLAQYSADELREQMDAIGRASRLARLSRFPDFAAFRRTYREAGFTSHIKAQYTAWRQQSTKPQGKALDDYKDGLYRQLNKWLRKGVDPGSQTIKDMVPLMDDALNAAVIDQDGFLMRGTTFSSGTVPDEWRLARPGDLRSDKGFISATVDRQVAEKSFSGRGSDSVVWDIFVPKGSRGLFIDPRLKGALQEGEVLLPRGTRFLVRQVDKEASGRLRITVELVP